MYPHFYHDLIVPGCRVIFIFTTAGDAGKDEKFWTAREEGTKSSVRFCLAPFSTLSESGGEKIFNGHSIHYWSVNNTTSYFFRLPDGSLDGKGHATGNFQSLSKLQFAEIEAITAIDNSASYRNWMEFATTLESVIRFESHNIPDCRIHYLNPDTALNPNDHPDHIATGLALERTDIIKKTQRVLFIGYSTCSGPEHLSPLDVFRKAGTFAAYEKAVYDCCGYSTLKENADLYIRWCCSLPKFSDVFPSI